MELDKSQIEFEIIIHEEYIPIQQALSFENTGADHSEYIEKVLEDDGYNHWLWCAVEVKATYKGVLTGSAYLGQCAYENEEEFKRDGYFEQMKEEAIEEIEKDFKKLLES